MFRKIPFQIETKYYISPFKMIINLNKIRMIQKLEFYV